MFREILSLYKKQGIGIIMVTHSMEDALQFANRLLVVYDGRIIMDGKPAALFRERRKELQDVGLDIPEIYKLKDALRAKGLAIPETVTDTASLLKEIRKRKGLK